VPFSAGTVVLEVYPSFNGVQAAARREGQKAGRALRQGVAGELKQTDKEAAKAGDSAGGAYAKAMRSRLERAISAVDIKVDADVSEAQRELKKFATEAKAYVADLDQHIEIDSAGALAKLREFEAQAKAIADDVDVDIDVRTNAAAARRELASFTDDLERFGSLTRREQAARVKAARDAAKAEREQNQFAEALRRRTLQNAYRENADFNARQAQLRRQESADIKRTNDQLIANYQNFAQRKADALRLARLGESEATTQAGRTGTDADALAAREAIRERFAAEGRYAEAAARARAASALRAAATEVISAEAVEHAMRDSYDEQSNAAARAASERIALARLAASVERRNAAGADNGVMQQAWFRNIGQAANSFRLFNGALLTAVTIGPLLIPILASIAAGLGGIAVAAVAAVFGIGVLFAGLAGIGTAVGALSAFDKEKRKQSIGSTAAKRAARGSQPQDTRPLRDANLALARAREDAGRRIKAANQAEARSEEDLARAHEDAADRIASANEARQRAERTLSDAVRSAADAQRDLIEARKQAAQDLEDQNNRLKAGLLNEALGAFDLEEAGARYNAVLEDPQATKREKEIARLTYEQQKQQYAELQTQNKRLAEEVAEANKKGVEGSDEVTAAKKRVEDANQAVIDQQAAVKEAEAEVTRARVDGAAAVVAAEQRVKEAQADTARARIEESRSIYDAELRVRDAQEDLRRGLQGVGTAAEIAGVAGTSAMDNLREAMDSLSPAGQEFARFLYGLKPLLDAIRDAAQTGLLPGLQAGIKTLVDAYGPDLIKAIGGIAKVLGDLFAAGAEALTAPWWREFFEEMGAVMPTMLKDLAYIFGAIVTGFAGLVKAFIPYAPEIMGFLVDLAEGFATWAKGLGGSEGFAAFMEYVRKEGPKVGALLSALLTILLKLAIGIAPYVDKLLDLFLGIVEWLASLSPTQIAAIALAMIAIVTAIQLLAGFMAVFSSLLGLIGGLVAIFGSTAIVTALSGFVAAAGPVIATIAGIIAIVALAVAGIILLVKWFRHTWETSETFRDRITNAINIVKSVLEEYGEIFAAVFEPIDIFLRTVVGPTIKWLWNDIIKPTFKFIGEVFNLFWQVFKVAADMIVQIVQYVIAPIIGALYTKYIKPVWENNIKPVFEALGSFIENNVAPAFKRGMAIIGGIWQSLIDFAKRPIEFIVNTVINKGIIDNFNKLVDIFPGMTKVKHIKLPASWNPGSDQKGGPGHGGGRAYATGGIMPGYTPGRDVHTFVSPTGGVLELSGGEPVLRPEAGRVLGRDWVDGINQAARTGGVGGVQGFLGGYKSGGIIGGFGDFLGDIGDAVGGAIASVKDLVTNPAKTLKKIINSIIGDAKGLVGMGKGIAFKVIDGIDTLLPGGKGGGGDQGAKGEGFGGIGWLAMQNIIKAAHPSLRITSGFRPGARVAGSGQLSMHALGRAIDIAPPSMSLFNWLLKNYPDSRQILYSPAGGKQIVWNGKRGDTSGITKQMHYNHVHWAMSQGGVVPNLYDNGGSLPPGLSLVANKTGKPEQVLTHEQFQTITGRGGDVTYQFDVEHMGADAHEVARELDTIRRDRVAAYGLPTIGVRI
jgi:hypothetical protein